jgi:hypothetical protein
MNRALFALAIAPACIPMIARADSVDYHWQNSNAQSLIGVMGQSKTIVEKDGSLSSPPWRFSFHMGSPEIGADSAGAQSLDGGCRPIVRTAGDQNGVRYELLAFGATIHRLALDMVRVHFYNTSNHSPPGQCTVDVHGPGAVDAAGNALVSGQAVVALADKPTSGQALVQIARNAWGNVSGWAPQLNWASPRAPADPAFHNITVGWAGKPIIYRFRVKPAEQYRVAMGFCEGYWSEPGKRILDVSLNGRLLQTLDPIAEAGQNVPVMVTGVATTPVDGWLTVEVAANKKAADQNTILNAIWVFPADLPVDQTALKEGHSSTKALFQVDCGSPTDRRLSAGQIELADDLAPGAQATFWLRFPHNVPAANRELIGAGSGKHLLNATRQWWDRFFRQGAQFSVPDLNVDDFYRASLAYTFLMRDRIGQYYVVKPGATVYNAFWYRDGSYIAHAHDIAGYPGEAERDLRVFTNRPLPPAVNAMGTSPIEQEVDGAWDAPRTEWDGQGPALWAIVSHYELTHDKEWLQKAYPAISRGAGWIRQARQASKQPQDAGTDHYGLLPQGFGEAIAGGNIYCYYHDFWGVLGIRDAAFAADALNKKQDATWMQNEASDFHDCLVTDVRKAQLVDSQGRHYIPGAPGSPAGPDQDGANIWGDIAAIYPCEAMDPQDPLIVSTFERMWDRQLQDEYQFITHRKIWTYITADWIQALWLQGHRQRALQLFWGYLNHAYTTKGWIEEMFPDTMVGTGDQPHGWAAANLVLLVRNMLVREDSGRLSLMYGIPGEWLASDRTIVVKDAPTTLGGPVSFVARRDRSTGQIMVRISQAPAGASTLRIWLPGFHIDRVIQADHAPICIDAEYVDVPSVPGTYEIVVDGHTARRIE